jgi:hypothetical protein
MFFTLSSALCLLLVGLFQQFVTRDLKVYAYANNHYAGYGPGTVKLFWDMWSS